MWWKKKEKQIAWQYVYPCTTSEYHMQLSWKLQYVQLISSEGSIRNTQIICNSYQLYRLYSSVPCRLKSEKMKFLIIIEESIRGALYMESREHDSSAQFIRHLNDILRLIRGTTMRIRNYLCNYTCTTHNRIEAIGLLCNHKFYTWKSLWQFFPVLVCVSHCIHIDLWKKLLTFWLGEKMK